MNFFISLKISLRFNSYNRYDFLKINKLQIIIQIEENKMARSPSGIRRAARRSGAQQLTKQYTQEEAGRRDENHSQRRIPWKMHHHPAQITHTVNTASVGSDDVRITGEKLPEGFNRDIRTTTP